MQGTPADPWSWRDSLGCAAARLMCKPDAAHDVLLPGMDHLHQEEVAACTLPLDSLPGVRATQNSLQLGLKK